MQDPVTPIFPLKSLFWSSAVSWALGKQHFPILPRPCGGTAAGFWFLRWPWRAPADCWPCLQLTQADPWAGWGIEVSVFRSKLLRLSNCGITGFSVSFQKLDGGVNAIQVSSTDLTNAYFAGKCFLWKCSSVHLLRCLKITWVGQKFNFSDLIILQFFLS